MYADINCIKFSSVLIQLLANVLTNCCFFNKAQGRYVNILINSLMKQDVLVSQHPVLFAVWHLCTVSALRYTAK